MVRAAKTLRERLKRKNQPDEIATHRFSPNRVFRRVEGKVRDLSLPPFYSRSPRARDSTLDNFDVVVVRELVFLRILLAGGLLLRLLDLLDLVARRSLLFDRGFYKFRIFDKYRISIRSLAGSGTSLVDLPVDVRDLDPAHTERSILERRVVPIESSHQVRDELLRNVDWPPLREFGERQFGPPSL
jgi:hypothetical protein